MSTGSKLVGYARCSTDRQDLTAQWDALVALGVVPDRIYVDHGLTGTDRKRPGGQGNPNTAPIGRAEDVLGGRRTRPQAEDRHRDEDRGR